MYVYMPIYNKAIAFKNKYVYIYIAAFIIAKEKIRFISNFYSFIQKV